MNIEFDENCCPLCGGELSDNVCVNCGFEVMAEADIAAPYDFVPYNDRFGEQGDEPEEEDEAEEVPVFDEAEPTGAKSASFQPQKPVNMPKNTPVQQNVSPLEIIIKSIVEDIKKGWWKLLITMLIPAAGICIGVLYCVLGAPDNNVRNMDFGKILKGIGYMALSCLCMGMGIGIGI